MQVVTSRMSKKPFSNFVVFHSARKAYTNFDALKSTIYTHPLTGFWIQIAFK